MGFTPGTHHLTPDCVHVTGPQSPTLGETKSWVPGPHLNFLLSWKIQALSLGLGGSSWGLRAQGSGP